ncbi:MAG TPA: DUF4293 domain-containing protein [Bacteroidales bacterium]|jgi:hypothetical protein|nr:DUF4293 domain-containing protein [Bacteroidales bacterium]HRS17936.1 DUF4293 domain-containing protein [Bacteroidales bacterium]
MIQRIQSLYLLLSAIVTAISLGMPFLQCSAPGSDVILYAFRISDSSSLIFSEHTPFYTLGASVSTSILLSVITIFLYTNRSLQMRLTIYGIILKCAILAVIGYVWYMLNSIEIQFTIIPQIGIICIAIAIVLEWLAYKGIQKDEKLVRSIDRIR